jgi:hypothetical protein
MFRGDENFCGHASLYVHAAAILKRQASVRELMIFIWEK